MNVVFLHGVAGSSATYRWLPREMTAGRNVVRLDFRGHGAAERTPGRYRLDGYVDDVLAVLGSLDGPAALVGHSLGGVTAWTVAQRHPELVTGAFLEDPPLYMGEPAGHARNGSILHFGALREAMVGWQANGTGIEAAAAKVAATPYAPDPARTQGEVLTPAAVAARAYALLHADPGVLDAVIAGEALASIDTASRVAAPVAILAAGDARDTAFPAAHAERLARTHPAVSVARLDGAGHSIHDERAHRRAYAERLAAFLAAVQ